MRRACGESQHQVAARDLLETCVAQVLTPTVSTAGTQPVEESAESGSMWVPWLYREREQYGLV